MQNENEGYNSIVMKLGELLNGRVDTEAVRQFKTALISLKELHGKTLSTRFLRQLVSGNPHGKTIKVSRVLSRADLNTRAENRYFKEFCSNGTIKRRECLNFVMV